MPSRSLPALPHWEHIRKQAKDLLADLRANDPASLSRAHVYSAAFSPARVASAPSAFCLSDAQLIVAREYGFASWPRLKQHVEKLQATTPVASPDHDNPQQPPLPDASETVREIAFVMESYPGAAQDIWAAAWEETRVMATPLRSDSDWEPDPIPALHWIRVNPPAHAWHHAYSDSWSHDVMDARGHLHTASSWDHSSLSSRPNSYTPDELLRKVLFPHFLPDESEESRVKELRTWRQETVEENGQPLLRWQRTTISGNFQVEEHVWAEPQTRRIARKERRETNLITSKLSTVDVCDRYTFNQPAPAGTFEMPSDKPLRIREESKGWPDIWDTLTAQEQQAIQEVIARSDAGWRAGDGRAFASAWKFDFQKHLPPETEWKQRVKQQAGQWREWISQIESASMQEGLPVRYNAHSFLIAMLKRKILCVDVKVYVRWQEGGDVWEGEAEFFLRKQSGRYRIVHWECPWAEIEAARKQAMQMMEAGAG